MHLLPFVVAFKGDQRDPDLGGKLMREAGGILQWIVDGALDYQRVGLNPPTVVTAATAEYFAAENLFDQWLEDCCETRADAWDAPTRLFNSWKRYAETANEKVGTQKSFGDRLAAAGFRNGNTRAKGGRHWDGLKLIPEQTVEHWQN